MKRNEQAFVVRAAIVAMLSLCGNLLLPFILIFSQSPRLSDDEKSLVALFISTAFLACQLNGCSYWIVRGASELGTRLMQSAVFAFCTLICFSSVATIFPQIGTSLLYMCVCAVSCSTLFLLMLACSQFRCVKESGIANSSCYRVSTLLGLMIIVAVFLICLNGFSFRVESLLAEKMTTLAVSGFVGSTFSALNMELFQFSSRIRWLSSILLLFAGFGLPPVGLSCIEQGSLDYGLIVCYLGASVLFGSLYFLLMNSIVIAHTLPFGAAEHFGKKRSRTRRY